MFPASHTDASCPKKSDPDMFANRSGILIWRKASALLSCLEVCRAMQTIFQITHHAEKPAWAKPSLCLIHLPRQSPFPLMNRLKQSTIHFMTPKIEVDISWMNWTWWIANEFNIHINSCSLLLSWFLQSKTIILSNGGKCSIVSRCSTLTCESGHHVSQVVSLICSHWTHQSWGP